MQVNFSNFFLNSIKDRTPDILLRVLRPANKSGAICPFCGNGSGNEGDGVSFVPGNPHIIKCFKCGTAKDIFSFVMEDRHCNFQEAVKTCADSAGINIEKVGSVCYNYNMIKKNHNNIIGADLSHLILPENSDNVKQGAEKMFEDMTPYFDMCHKFLTQWEEQIQILIDNGIYDIRLAKKKFFMATPQLKQLIISKYAICLTKILLTDSISVTILLLIAL